MIEDYKPYSEWWKFKLDEPNFRISLYESLLTFHRNMVNLHIDEEIKSREEWMRLFLLWLEYNK